MSYRPITDVWILARPKVKYYGAYPGGFLERARALLGVGISDPVLHVCAGRVREYPYPGGFGPQDRTLDLDASLEPDYQQDARQPFPCRPGGHGWSAVLIDPPYTHDDAQRYLPGAAVRPSPRMLLKHGVAAVRSGGRVGLLDYAIPRPPKTPAVKFVAAVAVLVGFENRVRVYSVFERRAA